MCRCRYPGSNLPLWPQARQDARRELRKFQSGLSSCLPGPERRRFKFTDLPQRRSSPRTWRQQLTRVLDARRTGGSTLPASPAPRRGRRRAERQGCDTTVMDRSLPCPSWRTSRLWNPLRHSLLWWCLDRQRNPTRAPRPQTPPGRRHQDGPDPPAAHLSPPLAPADLRMRRRRAVVPGCPRRPAQRKPLRPDLAPGPHRSDPGERDRHPAGAPPLRPAPCRAAHRPGPPPHPLAPHWPTRTRRRRQESGPPYFRATAGLNGTQLDLNPRPDPVTPL